MLHQNRSTTDPLRKLANYSSIGDQFEIVTSIGFLWREHDDRVSWALVVGVVPVVGLREGSEASIAMIEILLKGVLVDVLVSVNWLMCLIVTVDRCRQRISCQHMRVLATTRPPSPFCGSYARREQ